MVDFTFFLLPITKRDKKNSFLPSRTPNCCTTLSGHGDIRWSMWPLDPMVKHQTESKRLNEINEVPECVLCDFCDRDPDPDSTNT